MITVTSEEVCLISVMMAMKRTFLRFDMTTSQKKATSLRPMKNSP
jgi:hypothetical protein